MTSKNKNCCGVFLSELNPCQEHYSARDAYFASGDRILDIEETFGPSSWFAVIGKLALAAFTIYSWLHVFLAWDEKYFFFAFLTHVTMTLQIVYHLFSVWNSFSPPAGINGRIKFTWWMFNMVAHANLVVVLLYWSTDYDPDKTDLSFKIVAPHALTAIVCLMEGFLLNRIPIRVFHWWSSVLPFEIAYLTWTVIHAVLGLGNPVKSDDDPETNDDVLYGAIEWKDDAVGTAIFIVIVILVVGPIFQLVLFVMSLYSPLCRVWRRYLPHDGEEDAKPYNGADEEMFATTY